MIHTKPSLLSNPAVTSQLTSIISSLTSRINSGELSDANILQVIRQMTDVGFRWLFGAVLKETYFNSGCDSDVQRWCETKMLKSLYLTKIFLDQNYPSLKMK